MAHKQHSISLHNLPIAANINWNVPLIVWWLDDRISLLGPGANLKQLSEPGHHWKIVCHPNALSVSRTRENRRAPDRERTITFLSETVKSMQPSSNCWHHFTISGRVVHILSILHDESLYSWSVLSAKYGLSHVLQRWNKFSVDELFPSRITHQRSSLSEWNSYR